MHERSATGLPAIKGRYLLCLNVKGYRDRNGDRYFDPLWHKDLIEHLRYIENLTLAAPCAPLSPAMDAIRWDCSVQGIEFEDLPAPESMLRAILFLPRILPRLWRLMGHADIVELGIAGWPIPLSWVAAPMARLRRKPYLLFVESAPWRLHPGVKAGMKLKLKRLVSEAFGRWCVNRAALAIFTQEEYRRSLLTRRSHRGHLIQASWVDEEDSLSDAEAASEWRAKNPAAGGKLKLIFAGRLDRDKGIRVLLETIELLNREAFPVDLDILGTGELSKECETAARLLDGTAKVRAMGTVPYGAAFLRMLRPYHAVVVPSFSDEQPRIVYDAFSQALPVLASDTPGLRACVEDGQTGMISPANTPAAWVNLFKWCLDHLDQMERMGKAGLEIARRLTHREMHRQRWQLILQAFGERGAA